jgi:RNA polymerase sigma-70 factor (ECF subfamily)
VDTLVEDRRTEIAADVLERARAGDQEAFTQLVRHYDLGLRRLAFRLLGSRERADDVLQDAYVSAYRNLGRFRGEAGIGTWLYRITYNACLDELRRATRRPTAPLEEATEVAAAGPAPGELVAERDRLARALAALSPEHCAAVILVDVQGFDYATAGEALGVPEGTIASRLSNARAALRAALEPMEDDHG